MNNLSIFKKELTRKEFLVYLFGVVIAISGISALIRAFNPPSSTSGFGSGSYGG